MSKMLISKVKILVMQNSPFQSVIIHYNVYLISFDYDYLIITCNIIWLRSIITCITCIYCGLVLELYIISFE